MSVIRHFLNSCDARNSAVAIYYLSLKNFSRSDGSNGPSAAAYRAGERIRDERTGRIYDHSARGDVLHKEIILPSQFTELDVGWARDRAFLWNAAEAAEKRRNSRVAREYTVALPHELNADQRIQLVRSFAQELSDRYRFGVDLAVHAPRDFPGSDPRNFHAHLLATTREITPEGLGSKTSVELGDTARRELGLSPAVYELLHVRERWATVTNEALHDAALVTRIDHRTLREQGIDREPVRWKPRISYDLEQRDARSSPTVHREEVARETPRSAPDLDEMRREAREKWLRTRGEYAGRDRAADSNPGRDDDHSL
jgi:ATP-dependent exoDNAse (exonuclease V) alpha subunit